MQAFVFPGQGAQFSGMGKSLYDQFPAVKDLMEEANEVLGFRLTDTMFAGTDEALKQTNITQPAVFLHAVAAFKTVQDAAPQMVAGHSLGEFSALVANGCLSFADALRLVSIRATAMQKACEINPSGMAAVLNLADEKVAEICAAIAAETGEVLVPANYNCPGQLVISGSLPAIELACVRMKEAGAKRALPLPVGGAFHSPLMEPARAELAAAIAVTPFSSPLCPVYQNVNAQAVTDPQAIKANLIDQLTGPVKWTQLVQAMVADGATDFTECGPGKVLQGLIGKIAGTDVLLKGIN
ncbi:MAG: [acyl-carrier-protein] S-malonyltransferase [Sphingobacteriia bacterium]|nr:MAG: [acyl-carrier-protein] S-malonyltransferase [Sphingobacteriia bacterium]